MTALALIDVFATYPGANAPALAGVSVQLEAGEFVVVAGASGSGKSTFLHAACGVVPHLTGGTFGGQVVVAGYDTRTATPAMIGQRVGFVGQDPERQAVMTTVRAELGFGAEHRGASGASVARSVQEVALALGINGLLDRTLATLSGGELQRVALGAALVTRPDVLLLDEPTSQLDPVAADELIAVLRRLNEEWGTTVVLAEHRIERCLPAAHRVLAFADGTIACDADPETFLAWACAHEPVLATPGARLLHELGLPPQSTVRDARRVLAVAPAARPGQSPTGVAQASRFARRTTQRTQRRRRAVAAALDVRGLWVTVEGVDLLRGIDLSIAAGERVAVMGHNGAGKSTLLRHVAGLFEPSRGQIRSTGRVALLLQHAGDYLIAERVADHVGPQSLAAHGLAGLGERHPADLSGGERQRLAMAIVRGDGPPPPVLALDEPTRGLDRGQQATLAADLRALDAAVIVATHDPEFAAAVADRVVLLGDGEIVADAPIAELLCDGAYFATETARILDGAGAALLPEDGVAWLRANAGSGSVPVDNRATTPGAASETKVGIR